MAIQPVKAGGSSKLASLTMGALTGGVAGGAEGALAGAGKAALSGTQAGNMLAMQRMLESNPEPEKPGLNYTYGKDALDRRFGLGRTY